MKGKKKLIDYLRKEDYFIYDRSITSKAGSTNYYWYVCFPSEIKWLPTKSFNKQFYNKEEVIAYRDFWIKFYPEIYDKIQFYLNNLKK